MKKSSQLIIGSNSFLGVALTNILTDKGVSVIGIFHKNTNNLSKKISHIPIVKMNELDDNFDIVYIISAFVPVDHSISELDDKLNEVNVNLVESICKKFTNAKIVYCSSVSVYKYDSETIKESNLVEPKSAYGRSKLLGEAIVSRQNKHAIVRISSMYGPNMKLTTFMPRIILKALKDRRITIFGNGKRLQNYIHVNDVARYLVAASEYHQNEIFLAAYPNSFSNERIAKCIQENMNDITIEFQGIDDSKSYIYDNNFTNKSLNINCSIDLNNGINQLITWMKKEF